MFKESFFKVAIQANALQFGNYKLKSGRISPYFFNAGLFNNGKDITQLSYFYVKKIIQEKIKVEVLFGPAYKGIPLVAIISAMMFEKYSYNIGFCYNRKEIKDHGEGGNLVGANLFNKKVLIIDDVITAGTSIIESINLLQSQNAKIVGAILALDRQESFLEEKVSTNQAIEKKYNFPIFSIATFKQLIKFMKNCNTFNTNIFQNIQNYNKSYGII